MTYAIPRRFINGRRYYRPGPWIIDVNGIVGYFKGKYGQEFIKAGLAMGCVRYDRETFTPIPLDQAERKTQ